jgi:hypothetical protein
VRQLLAACSALCLTHAAVAWAQPEPPARPDAGEANDEAEDEPGAKAAAAPSEVPEEPLADPEPPPPLLPPPSAGEQQPGPYVASPEPAGRQRKLEIGPDFGVTLRPAAGDAISYSPGLSWGAHLRIELVSFLGLRAYFNNTRHAVDVPAGALGPTDDTEIDQDALAVTIIGARLEPTWVVTPELRLWVGAGIAWGRVVAKEPSAKPAIAGADRRAVLLELTGSLGASYDLIPSWLCVSLLLNGGIPTNQSGDMFDRQQVIDQAGTIDYLRGLPEFESTFSALVGLGLIL